MVVFIIMHCAFFFDKDKSSLPIIYHHIQAEHLLRRIVSDFKSLKPMGNPNLNIERYSGALMIKGITEKASGLLLVFVGSYELAG